MLNQSQITQLQTAIKESKNPLFIFDDDADGLCSYLLLYRIKREGHYFMLKAAPNLEEKFVKRVKDFNPDLIVILDIPDVHQEFIDAFKVPIFWIDHHDPQQKTKVTYFNPKIKEPTSYFPTTRMAYQVANNPKELWIATAGCLADWHCPDFIEEAAKAYPDYFPKKKRDLPTLVFKSKIGKLVQFFFFMIKGPSSDVARSIKILGRISSPDEIFNPQSEDGHYLFKRFEMLNVMYERLLAQAVEKATRSKILLFEYNDEQWSFTANLANELTTRYPKKVVIIARKSQGFMKCSLRAQFPIEPALKRALTGIEGYGGGHPTACGAVIKNEDWDRFQKQFNEELKKK